MLGQHRQALAELVHKYIEDTPVLSDWPELRTKLLHGLSTEPDYNLALSLLTCQAVGGEPEAVLPVAAGWLCLSHAAHWMDAATDIDQASSDKESLNRTGLATSLIFAGFQFVAEIKDSIALRRVLSQFSSAGLNSALGQTMFISPTNSVDQHEDALEQYWQAVILKSGSIYRAGAAGGAAAITNRQDWIEAMGDYGSALGVMLQVLDDCRDHVDDRIRRAFLPGLPTFLEKLMPGSSEDTLPETISLILLEWQRRAVQALSGFPNSPTIEILRQLPARIINLQPPDLPHSE
jgi:hypothetical protein